MEKPKVKMPQAEATNTAPGICCLKNSFLLGIYLYIPLNDNIPEHSAIDVGDIDEESSFEPLVTSITPYKKPFNICDDNPNFIVILERNVEIKLITLKASKSSVIK